MIKINRNINIPKINRLYEELDSAEEDIIDLSLPTTIDRLEFGVLFSYLQFLATWIRHKKSGKLYLPVGSIEEAVMYLNDNEFVYPSIVLAWEKEIISKHGEDLKNSLKEPSKLYFTRMDFLELKGRSVPLFCFDHDKSNRGLSKNFYNRNRQLVTEDTLGFNLFRAFQKVGSNHPAIFRSSIKSNLESFIALIHELFSNTHEHAKTNEFGHNLYPNIRGIQLKFHARKLANYLDLYSEFEGLVSYFNSGFNTNQTGDLYLIEISILDSGPGLTKRFKELSEYNISINEEVEIIKSCLHRHNTSASGLQGEIKGLGLDRVLQTIDGKGFVRIKSGRVDVFKDMKAHRYTFHEKATDIELYDWKNNSPTDFTVYPATEGTLISIFYPLDYTQT
ncbi:MAG: hypothetical protein HWE07_00105 [Cytophagia bacterium]|nr:hypothetical protein [Cytophagia bacterium]